MRAKLTSPFDPRRPHPATVLTASLLAGWLLPWTASTAGTTQRARPPATADQAGAGRPASDPALRPLMTAVVLNGTPVSDSQLVHLDGEPDRLLVWLPTAKARQWRMDTQGRAQRFIESVNHVAWCAGRDRCLVDEAAAVLAIDVAGDALLPLVAGPVVPPRAEPSDAQARGAYVNYDLSAWHQGGPGLAASLEGRAFAAHGHAAVRFDALHAAGRLHHRAVAAYGQIDDPAGARSLQIGSTAIPPLPLAPGLAIVGLLAGSNARLQPLHPQSLRPSLLLQAGPRPVRAEVFVDGQWQRSVDVPYGPYRLDVQPRLPGRGTVDIRATDSDGTRHDTTLLFYQAPQLLQPGSQEWSLAFGVAEAPDGRVRARGAGVAAASLRQGLSSATTVLAQALLTERATRTVLGIDRVDPRLGQGSLSVVNLRSSWQTQTWLGAGYEFVARGGLLALRTERLVQGTCTAPATPGLGSSRVGRLAPPCHRLLAAAGLDLAGGWSLSANRGVDIDAAAPARSASQVELRWQFRGQAQLALTVQRQSMTGLRVGQVGVGVVMPLAPGWMGQVSTQQRRGPDTAQPVLRTQWSAFSAPAPGDSAGHRQQLYGSIGPEAEIGARHVAQAETFEWQLEGRADSRGSLLRGGVAGAWGTIEGRRFASRRIDDAFVVVDVGLAGLPVLLDNREVARTNAQGWAVVTEARAHQANSVRVDTAALPAEYALPHDQAQAVPTTHGGVRLAFALSDGGVAVTLVDAAGQHLPAGTRVQVSSQRLHTAVTSRGQVFLDRAGQAADLEAQGPGAGCRARYEPQAGSAVLRCVTS